MVEYIFIAANNKLPSRCINIPDNMLEIVIVLIKLDHKNLVISFVYIPNKCRSVHHIMFVIVQLYITIVNGFIR